MANGHWVPIDEYKILRYDLEQSTKSPKTFGQGSWMAETFTLHGKPIEEETLRRIWEEIRTDLKNEYSVESIEMPRIIGRVLTYKRFIQFLKKAEASPHMTDMSEIEYPETEYPPRAFTVSALTFFGDIDQIWYIVKCQGVNPLELDLKHELLHIWESILGLRWGSLTGQRP